MECFHEWDMFKACIVTAYFLSFRLWLWQCSSTFGNRKRVLGNMIRGVTWPKSIPLRKVSFKKGHNLL